MKGDGAYGGISGVDDRNNSTDEAPPPLKAVNHAQR